MNNTILVSVIIPVYNVAEYIERCFLSVLNQTYKNLEIIFIDDKSPDNSVDVILNLLSKCDDCKDRVKLIRHDKNKGLSASRNTGIVNSSGAYLYFLDSDDCLSDAHVIQFLVSLVKSDRFIDVVIGNLSVFKDGIPNKISPFKVKEDETYDTNKEFFSSYIRQDWYTMAVNKLINKDFLLKNNLFFHEDLLHEDFLWSFQLALYANTAILSTRETYNYFMRTNGSITSDIKKKNGEDLVYIYNRVLHLLISDNRYSNNISVFRYLENIKLYSVFLYTIKLNKKDWISNVKQIEKMEILSNGMTMKDYIKRCLLSLPPSLLYDILLKFSK